MKADPIADLFMVLLTVGPFAVLLGLAAFLAESPAGEWILRRLGRLMRAAGFIGEEV